MIFDHKLTVFLFNYKVPSEVGALVFMLFDIQLLEVTS